MSGAGFTFPGEYMDPALGAPLDVATVPSGAFETAEPFSLSQQIGRAIANERAESYPQDEFGNLIGMPEANVSPEALNQKYGVADSASPLRFTSPLPDSVAKSMYDAKQEELTRRLAAARRPPGFIAGLGTFGADFAANALDPLNIAAAFVPVVSEARYAMWLDQAGSLLGRAAVRAGVGAAQGAAGQIPLSALRYGLTRQEQGDYSAVDAMLDIAYGGALGGILHAGGGAIAERFHPVEGLPAVEPNPPDPIAERMAASPLSADDLHERLLRTAIAQGADDRPIEVRPAAGEAGMAEEPPPAAVAAETEHPLQAPPAAPASDVIEAAINDIAKAPTQGERDLVQAAETAAQSRGPDPMPEATPLGALGVIEPPGRDLVHEKLPPEPERLIPFLRRNGGVRDEGGDIAHTIGGPRARPGLINNRTGMTLDDATVRAMEEGYLRRENEPAINDLLDAIGADHRGVAQYADQDEERVAAYRQAQQRNAEIDRLSAEFGIAVRGKTRDVFWDTVADRASEQRAGAEMADLAQGWQDEFAAAEERAKQWIAEHGGEREPYIAGEPRTLDDLESELRQRGGAEGMGEVPGGAGGPGPAGGDQGDVQGGVGQGGGGIGAGQRAGAEGAPERPGAQPGSEPGRPGEPATELTDQGEQFILPGGERSARQAATAREAEGRGMMRAGAEQKAPGGMFEQQAPTPPDLFAALANDPRLAPEDLNELREADAALQRAPALRAGFEQASQCIARGLAG